MKQFIKERCILLTLLLATCFSVAFWQSTAKVDAAFVSQGVTTTSGILTIKDDRQLVCSSSVHYQSLCLGVLELSALKNPDVDKILANRFGFVDGNGQQIIPRPAQ